MRLVRRVVGDPTGTSLRLCENMCAALQMWAKKHYNYQIPLDKVTLFPLECEGLVEERVEKLLEMVDAGFLKKAKLILVAAHSQGVPTSVMFVSQLVQLGILDPKQQTILILGHGGISHGPFPVHRDSLYLKLEAEAAKQLFDFNSCTSMVSRRYYADCLRILDAGIRFVSVGSWLDQIVPLYSSCFHALNHKNTYKAVFVDKEDDFLISLVEFALKLRNMGKNDHDLLVHLSNYTSGTMFTRGHSLIYQDMSVYELALNFLFSKPQFKLSNIKEWDAPKSCNPNYLLYCMSKLLGDGNITGDLRIELVNLLNVLEEWNPKNKIKREIKYRLEPLNPKRLISSL